VRLAIYDVAGRRVRAIADRDQATGEHEIAWDQRDDAGRSVPAGLYFARMEVKGRVLTQKLITLK
jgi:flagellar hook assembly protein FlgD